MLMNFRLLCITAIAAFANLLAALPAAAGQDTVDGPGSQYNRGTSSSSSSSSSGSSGTTYRSNTYQAPAPQRRQQPNYGAALGAMSSMMEAAAAIDRQNAYNRQLQQEQQQAAEAAAAKAAAKAAEDKRIADDKALFAKDAKDRKSINNPFPSAGNVVEANDRQGANNPFLAGAGSAVQANSSQSADNPFRAPGSADEADWNVAGARRAKEKAEIALNACRRKNNPRPGLDNGTVCVAEQAAVQKYQQYRDGWGDESIRRGTKENAGLRERERRQISVEEAQRIRQQETVEVDETATSANPFTQAGDAYREAKKNLAENIRRVKDRANNCKDKLLDGGCE